MRVLLVRPPVPRSTIGLKHLMVCEPLELEYVAAGLQGHEVKILDLIVERGLERCLARFRPQVLATSCYITGVNEAIKVCRSAKRWSPNVWTVVGGVHASRAPEDFVDPAVDVIVVGDGTTMMPEVVDAIHRGQPLDEVPGLALPAPEAQRPGIAGAPSFESSPRETLGPPPPGARVRRTPSRPYMPHPDTLPFPRRELTAHLRERYYYLAHRPLALLKTTWGCWYRCAFCFNWRVTDGQVFVRSPESIVDELATIEEEEVYIVDDIFLANRARLDRVAQLLRSRGIRKHYLCFGRSDFIAANEDVIAEWAALGLKAVLVGLEAATDEELEGMGKRSTVDHNRRAIEILRKHGIDTYGSLIPDPSYGPEDWARLWSFIEENGLYYLNISPLTPLPGTELWEQCRGQLTVPRQAHGLWDLSHAVLPTRQPLKVFYRQLLGIYSRAILDPRRARRLRLNEQAAIWKPGSLRMWLGALQIWLQLHRAHLHHKPRGLAQAMDRGAPLPPPPASAPRRTAGTGRLRVRVEEDVDAIEEEDWDHLLDPEDLQASHRFVRTCQASDVEAARYVHVLIQDEKGPLALASLSAFLVSLDLLAPAWTRGVSGRIRTLAPRFLRLPLVIGGLPVSFNQSCLRMRRGADPGPILNLVGAAAEDLAAQAGASILCFKEFPAEEVPVARGLETLGFSRCVSLPSCHLPLPYGTFEEYVAAMRSGYRRQLRATGVPSGNAELSIRLEELAPHVHRIFPLYQEVMNRAEFQLERLNETFFLTLAREMAPESSALLLESGDGSLIAAAVLLRGPRRTTFLITGIDYQRSRPVRGYERLVTAVVRQAIEWGAESVELGQTSWELKRRLGAQLSPRYLFFRHRKPLGDRILRASLPFLFPERHFPERRVFRASE